VLSHHKNPYKGSFSRSLRLGIVDKEKGKLPGPKYLIFSEFGTRKL
jgi:hypothetical protein